MYVGALMLLINFLLLIKKKKIIKLVQMAYLLSSFNFYFFQL